MTTSGLLLECLEIRNERDATARPALMKSHLTEDSFHPDLDCAGPRGHVEPSEAMAGPTTGAATSSSRSAA